MMSARRLAVAIAFVLFTATSAAALTIPWETRTGYMSTDRFGWAFSYDIGVFDDELRIHVDIALVGVRTSARLRNRWESGIEALWSTDRFSIPIVFDVDWVDKTDDPDYVVRVRRGSGYWNLRTWYRGGPLGWGRRYHEEVAAHEFGHMVSLWDEYEGGAIDPVTRLIETGGLMHTLDGPTLDYYYEPFLSWYEPFRPDPPPAPSAREVANTAQKGSLLIFPLVDVRPGTTTIVRISNDANSGVDVKCHYVNQTRSRSDFMFRLTQKQSVAFDAVTGVAEPLGNVQRFPTDAGPSAGNPLLGELVCFAVNTAGSAQISHNHLSGTATVIATDSAGAEIGAYEYNSWNFTARGVARGGEVGMPGRLELTGADGGYDACPRYNVVHFSPTTSEAIGEMVTGVPSDHRLGVTSCAQDLRQDSLPHVTKLRIEVWNANEVKFAGAWHCAESTASFLLSEIDMLPQNASATVLGTSVAQARIRGVASTHCPGSEEAGLLVAIARIHRGTDLIEVPLHAATAHRAGISAVPGFVLWDPEDDEVPEMPRR